MNPTDELEPQDEAAALGRLGRLLDGAVDAAQHREGRDRLVLALGASSRGQSTRWLLLAATLACLLAGLAVVVVVARRPVRLEYQVSGPVVPDGEWLGVAPESEPLAIRFSEGTEIELGPGSKGKVDDLTGDGARVVLGGGLLHARVVHRPRTHWTVAAGPYAVEVTGTAFDVGWSSSGERLELSLHDGSVIVRGPSFPDGIRVGAGQRLVAHARTGGAELSSLFAPEPSADAPPSAPSSLAPAAAEPVESSVESSPPARVLRSWSDRLADEDFQGVIDAAEGRGIAATLGRASLADLAALSDAARYVHDCGLAKRGLLAERARFAGSVEARAAAFVLGRMADDGSRDGASRDEALRWYDVYLAESPGGSFAAEALGRKLVVLVDSGNATTARSVASEYLRRFPHGAHAAYARQLLTGP